MDILSFDYNHTKIINKNIFTHKHILNLKHRCFVYNKVLPTYPFKKIVVHANHFSKEHTTDFGLGPSQIMFCYTVD